MKWPAIRVFPRATKWTPEDNLAFIGDPPLAFARPSADLPVYISVTFTWDVPEGKRLAKAWGQYYQNVKLGGPALGDSGGEFIPGMFIKQGITITSRGCPNHCPWCFVPKREGQIRELEIRPGWIVQDNNLLACSDDHIKDVLNMLRKQSKGAVFKGGLEAAKLKKWHVEQLQDMRVNELWFACDTQKAFKPLEEAAGLLHAFPERKRRCFVMIGFRPQETLQDAENRLKAVYDLGFLPFCQLYQPVSGEKKRYPKEWRQLAKFWARPAAYRSLRKKAA